VNSNIKFIQSCKSYCN